MIILKSDSDIKAMRAAGGVANSVLNEVAAWITPGISTLEIDEYVGAKIAEYGAKSAFLGYRKYPCHACISVNEEVVHGIAGPRRVQFGDLVSLDIGVVHEGFIGDNAKTVAVGGCNVEAQRLMDVTLLALNNGIAQAVSGNHVGDISKAVQETVEKHGYSVVREFVGHGVGRTMHEEPQVPNFVDGKRSAKLRPGMTIAIEPMVNQGEAAVKVLKDGWTVITRDGLPSCHFEHTVAITEGEPEILTNKAYLPAELKTRPE